MSSPSYGLLSRSCVESGGLVRFTTVVTPRPVFEGAAVKVDMKGTMRFELLRVTTPA